MQRELSFLPIILIVLCVFCLSCEPERDEHGYQQNESVDALFAQDFLDCRNIWFYFPEKLFHEEVLIEIDGIYLIPEHGGKGYRSDLREGDGWMYYILGEQSAAYSGKVEISEHTILDFEIPASDDRFWYISVREDGRRYRLESTSESPFANI